MDELADSMGKLIVSDENNKDAKRATSPNAVENKVLNASAAAAGATAAEATGKTKAEVRKARAPSAKAMNTASKETEHLNTEVPPGAEAAEAGAAAAQALTNDEGTDGAAEAGNTPTAATAGAAAMAPSATEIFQMKLLYFVVTEKSQTAHYFPENLDADIIILKNRSQHNGIVFEETAKEKGQYEGPNCKDIPVQIMFRKSTIGSCEFLSKEGNNFSVWKFKVLKNGNTSLDDEHLKLMIMDRTINDNDSPTIVRTIDRKISEVWNNISAECPAIAIGDFSHIPSNVRYRLLQGGQIAFVDGQLWPEYRRLTTTNAYASNRCELLSFRGEKIDGDDCYSMQLHYACYNQEGEFSGKLKFGDSSSGSRKTQTDVNALKTPAKTRGKINQNQTASARAATAQASTICGHVNTAETDGAAGAGETPTAATTGTGQMATEIRILKLLYVNASRGSLTKEVWEFFKKEQASVIAVVEAVPTDSKKCSEQLGGHWTPYVHYFKAKIKSGRNKGGEQSVNAQDKIICFYNNNLLKKISDNHAKCSEGKMAHLKFAIGSNSQCDSKLNLMIVHLPEKDPDTARKILKDSWNDEREKGHAIVFGDFNMPTYEIHELLKNGKLAFLEGQLPTNAEKEVNCYDNAYSNDNCDLLSFHGVKLEGSDHKAFAVTYRLN